MSTDDIERLHHRMDSMERMTLEVRDNVRDLVTAAGHQQSTCTERMGGVKESLDAVYKTLYGNGRKGLDDRVTALETVTEERRTMTVGSGSISVKAMVTIIAAIGTMLGGLMGYLPAVIEALVKHAK